MKLKKILSGVLIGAFVFGISASNIQPVSAASMKDIKAGIDKAKDKFDKNSDERPEPPDRNSNSDSQDRPEPPRDSDGNILPPPDRNSNGDSQDRPEPPRDSDGNILPPPDKNDTGKTTLDKTTLDKGKSNLDKGKTTLEKAKKATKKVKKSE